MRVKCEARCWGFGGVMTWFMTSKTDNEETKSIFVLFKMENDVVNSSVIVKITE